MEFIVPGLLLGLVTSFHCVGMCGPIAIALPLQGAGKVQRLIGGLLYNLGRTTTYIIFGLILGSVGQGLGALGFQRWVSIIAGVLMIITALSPSLLRSGFDQESLFSRFLEKIKLGLKRLFSIRSFGSLYSIGLINGLLPCGPLYMAFIISTGTGNAITAALFMMMFGLGTLPLLFAVTILGNFISIPLRNKINNFLPVLIVVIGILFILRGLNLGIPYLSPKEEMIKKKVEKTIKNQASGLDDSMKHEIDSGDCCKN